MITLPYYSSRRNFPTCHRNLPGLSSLKLTLFNLLMRNDIAAAGVAIGPWDRTTKEVQRFWTVESYLEKASDLDGKKYRGITITGEISFGVEV